VRPPDAVLLIAIIAVATIPSGRAQQVPVFRTTADIVQIDVSVLDRESVPSMAQRPSPIPTLGNRMA
jgi:hypothetical protein